MSYGHHLTVGTDIKSRSLPSGIFGEFIIDVHFSVAIPPFWRSQTSSVRSALPPGSDFDAESGALARGFGQNARVFALSPARAAD